MNLLTEASTNKSKAAPQRWYGEGTWNWLLFLLRLYSKMKLRGLRYYKLWTTGFSMKGPIWQLTYSIIENFSTWPQVSPPPKLVIFSDLTAYTDHPLHTLAFQLSQLLLNDLSSVLPHSHSQDMLLKSVIPINSITFKITNSDIPSPMTVSYPCQSTSHPHEQFFHLWTLIHWLSPFFFLPVYVHACMHAQSSPALCNPLDCSLLPTYHPIFTPSPY